MISGGGITSISEPHVLRADVLIYGLGFETRSTYVARRATASRIVALRLPRVNIHRYDENVRWAETRKHWIVNDYREFAEDHLKTLIDRSACPVSFIFDISSVTRSIMAAVLLALHRHCRPEDSVSIIYAPAQYAEPDMSFPQIEKLGPVSGHFSSFDADPARPLCLMLGLGFEPGVSMGIISQLEPRMSFCFWGAGVDSRFDSAVRKANFDFDFAGFSTRQVRYRLDDPRGSFDLMESITYGLLKSYNVIIVPMGPKLFSMFALLLGVKYSGKIAVWRVQQRKSYPPDAAPQGNIIVAKIDMASFSLQAA